MHGPAEDSIALAVASIGPVELTGERLARAGQELTSDVLARQTAVHLARAGQLVALDALAPRTAVRLGQAGQRVILDVLAPPEAFRAERRVLPGHL